MSSRIQHSSSERFCHSIDSEAFAEDFQAIKDVVRLVPSVPMTRRAHANKCFSRRADKFQAYHFCLIGLSRKEVI